MAPARSSDMTADLTTFFNQMQQEVDNIATQQSTSSSTVITVDIATGFTDAYFADPVHYNETGALFVANRYYTVLTNVLKQ